MINIYCYRNRKTGSYTLPEYKFEQPQDMERAIRRYCILNTKEAVEKQHFDEMELFHLGSYDDEHGLFNLLEVPTCVADFGPLCTQLMEAHKDA